PKTAVFIPTVFPLHHVLPNLIAIVQPIIVSSMQTFTGTLRLFLCLLAPITTVVFRHLSTIIWVALVTQAMVCRRFLSEVWCEFESLPLRVSLRLGDECQPLRSRRFPAIQRIQIPFRD